MTLAEVFADGKPVRFGNRIGKGGEGEVYALADDETRAIKIYTAHDGAKREAKIEAIVRMKLAQQSSLVAFPVAVARDKAGRFAGFIMHRVRDHKPLFELHSPGARKQHFPKADYRFLARAALNTAKAVAAVHKAGCVIGDINHSGILISNNATAALIDADSFQVTDGSKSYLCRVGVPEYTPPELQGVKLGEVVRTPNHDAFGLAITIFLLIAMGRHPFVGSHSGGDIPIEKAIAEFRFAYSRKRSVGMTPPPGASTLDDFPGNIAAAFETAFGPSHRDMRPTAVQWVSLLQDFEQSLRKCLANPLHYYSRAAPSCPWCRMEKRLGVVLFIPAYVDIPSAGAGDLNLPLLWAQIESVRIPTRAELTPIFSALIPTPSPAAIEAKRKTQGTWAPQIFTILIGVAIAIAEPGLWVVALCVAALGFLYGGKKGDFSSTFRERFLTVENEWNAALDEWERRCGIEKIENLKASLTETKQAYEALPAEQAQLEQRYRADRESFQRTQFLDRFRIRDFKIPGIGPSKLATLASYGIETAADVTQEKVLAVPGFGPINSVPLLEWQREFARKFVYNRHSNVSDQLELQKIKASIDQRAQSLRQILTSQARELSQAVEASKRVRTTPDSALAALHARKAQIEADLSYLNIPLPPRPQRAPRPSRPPLSRPQSFRPTTITPAKPQTPGKPAVMGAPMCPLCSHPMVRRAGRRGGGAGRPFWGCSRFPKCRGTRPI